MVGGENPARGGLVPVHLGHLGLEQRVAVEIVVPADGLAVRLDLRTVGVLLLRDIVEFFEQRQIDVRLDVALRARVTVPVPRPAEVTAGLDHPDAVDAGLS